MKKRHECLVCGKAQDKIFSYHNFHYFKCIKCGFISTYPIPNKNAIESHYKKEFNKGNYKFIRTYSKQYEKIYSGFLNEIKKYLKKSDDSIRGKRILDIGCFTGEFLILASKEKADVYGVELQKDAVIIANKKLQGRVLQKDIDNNPFGNNKKFDIITIFGLIEHVHNPFKLITHISKMLKINGLLVIQTPNAGSLLALVMKKYWPPFTPIEHIHFFNRKNIKLLLDQNDLKTVRFKNHIKILPIGYVYNMLNVFGPEIKSFLKPVEKMLINSPIKLPFYVGEMFLIAKKTK